MVKQFSVNWSNSSLLISCEVVWGDAFQMKNWAAHEDVVYVRPISA